MTRTVTKVRAGAEDLLIGEGVETQSRGSGSFPITKIRLPYLANDLAELDTVPTENYTKAFVFTGASYNAYVFQDDQWVQATLPTVGVNTVFGRNGNVVAEAGDYDSIQITFSDISFSGTATNVEEAISNLDTRVLLNTANISTLQSDLGSLSFTASQIVNDSSVPGTNVDNALDELQTQIANLPTPVSFKGGLDVSTGDAALPASPSNGDQYRIIAEGTITVTEDGSAPAPRLAQVGDSITYDGTVWWLFESEDTQITQSQNDTTLGRVTKVGDYGFGTDTVEVVVDLNTNFGRVAGIGPTTVNRPFDNGTVIVLPLNSNDTAQIASSVNSDQLFIRRRVGGVWQAWVEILKVGDFGYGNGVLASTGDLGTFTDGKFVCLAAVTNLPTAENYAVEVFRSDGSSGAVFQAQVLNTNRRYIGHNDSGGVITWTQVLTGGLIETNEVNTPYSVLATDLNKFIVFNSATDATLLIPDGLSVGLSVAVVNIGGGGVILSPNTDTVRGALVLGDVNGYLAVTKITSTVWQSSERA